MTEESNTQCSRCGAPLPGGDSQELCAACLMLQAMQTDPGDETIVMERGPGLAINGPDQFPFEFGDYQLTRLLGRGGMGTVYEAIQRSTGRRVALKMLGQQLESGAMRQRFLREGRLAAGVNHPNSLYVYGAEEIEGVPVITMEIVESGTLSDELKKRGPLPIADAVDAVLGIISGLEAAQSVGVLHRDVKPSNVFVRSDGSVTVGDYGLSVSTVATVDSFATATGVALGTPAYAAPEQLKGVEIDLRADIYSVGATLYTLLTNRAPIEGKNPVQIVAAALDEKPTSVNEVRREVPTGLASIVAKCLSKKPEQRFANYDELRRALLPFSSEVPKPGPLRWRFLAGLLDILLGWSMPSGFACAYYGRMNTVEMLAYGELLPLMMLLLWQVIYFGLPEGIWGASLGKWLSGLRVTRESGQQVGMGRAVLRALTCWAFLQGGVIALVLLRLNLVGEPSSFWQGSVLYGTSQWLLLFVAFATMRRANGWALVWDLWTGSRVIERARSTVRPPLADLPSESEPSERPEYLGPYAIVERLSSDWVVAIDPTLRRRVWLRRTAGKSFGNRRRDLSRPGRARWLQSVVDGEDTWNVFEAQPGVVLSELVASGRRVHWGSVRYWLYDLTLELAQASQDETLPPELGLNHVWITVSGQALILDEGWPASKSIDEVGDVSETRGKLRFLERVSQCASPETIPVHARMLLAGIANRTFEKLSFLAGNLRSALGKRAAVDVPTRAASLLILPLLLSVVAFFGMYIAGPAAVRAKSVALQQVYPNLPALNDVLRYRYWLQPEDRRLVHVHIAAHYTYEDFVDYQDWDHYRLLSANDKEVLKEVTVPGPSFTAEELAEANRQVAEMLPKYLEVERRKHLAFVMKQGTEFVGRCLGWMAILQLVTILVARATIGQYLFGFAVVDAEGALAGRGRLLLRWSCAWCPFLAALMGTQWVGELGLILLLIWLVGAMVAVAKPNRGLHDDLSGCWLVSR